ncbi:hypothetical protein TCAL_05075 [Tigriopus californicus]|uniref:Uncharacterized protein n=1 Tax=Tigriopus californicus TaxID=6832 RepID=A0A553NTW4_TIGCA|nr:hypothetical protein TCAL_05075 [Tigriopus californicus]|eukprot:TCALIF_05075-PA protein Name:"Similar to TRIM24 Transcription intermediary factor 1-alpha (Homo sapiens)" AED:0.08 eAED:0.08 QI:0/0.7/0.54/1/1/1/11/206/1699
MPVPDYHQEYPCLVLARRLLHDPGPHPRLSIGRPQSSGSAAPLDRLSQLGGISMRPVGNVPADRPLPSPPARSALHSASTPSQSATQDVAQVASKSKLNLDHLKKLNLVVKAPAPLTSSGSASSLLPPPGPVSSTTTSSSNDSDQTTGIKNYRPEIKESRHEDIGFDLSKVKMEPGTEPTNHFAAAYIKQPVKSSTNEKESDEAISLPKVEESNNKFEKSTSPNNEDIANPEKSTEDDEPHNAPDVSTTKGSDEIESDQSVKASKNLQPTSSEDAAQDKNSVNPDDEVNDQTGPEHLESIKKSEEPKEECDGNDEEEGNEGIAEGSGNPETDVNMDSQEDEEEDMEEDEVDEDGAPITKSEPADLIRRESVNSDEVQSPFKKPPDFGFNENGSASGLSQGGNRFRHRSTESFSDCSESGKSVMDSQQQYQTHLAFCKKPLVGQETICIICLTRCCDKEPKLLTCLHSTCQACFQSALDDARKEHKTVESVSLDDDVAPIEQDVFILCPLCKVSTSETELSDNLFLEADGEGDSIGIQVCESCDEANPADSHCQDCEENLCGDCVKAHQRVKITKDHKLNKISIPKRRKTNALLAPKDFFCTFHPTDRRTIFCDTCETLICNECKNAGPHKDHSTRSSFEAAPDVKEQLTQQISDIRLKRNTLDENRSLLGAKLNELAIKEKSLKNTITEVKDYLLARIEARFRGLTNELGRGIREKRRAIEGRKTTLDRFHVQTDYAIAFVDNALLYGDEDDAILVAKRALERQLRRLKKVDPSTGLSENTREFKLDLYFQHFSGPQLHTSLESVLKQVMMDVKILSAPPPVPEIKPNIPIVPQTVNPGSSLPPGANLSNLGGMKTSNNAMMSPQARLMANVSHRSPNVTPTKTPLASRGRMSSPIASRGRGVVARGRSPMRGGAISSLRGRGMAVSRGTARGVVGSRSGTGRGTTPVKGSPRGGSGRGIARGRGVLTSRGVATRGVPSRGQAVATRGSRGRGSVTSGRGASIAMSGSNPKGAIGRGVVIPPNISKQTASGQSVGNPTKRIMSLPPGTIAVPASPSTSSSTGKGVSPTMSLEQQRKLELVRLQQEQKQKQLQLQQSQNSAGQPQTDDRYFKAAYGRSNGVPNASIQSFSNHPRQEAQHGLPPPPVSSSSWHMPSPQIGAGVSITPSGVTSSTVEKASPHKPPLDNSFKIKLPGMNRGSSTSTAEMKYESSNVDLNDDVESLKVIDREASNSNKNIITLEPSVRNKRPKSRDELPDLSSLLSDDEELSGSPADWVNKEQEGEPIEQDPLSLDSNPVAGNKNEEPESNGQELSSNDPEPESPVGQDLGSFSEPVPIKIELSLNGKSKGKRSSRSASKADAEMKKETPSTTEPNNHAGEDNDKDEEWCAVCHDGGDILYCCDRCPKVYHLYCYIPPLTSEPPDDWVCLMCATKAEIQQFPNKKDKQSGKLGNRDLKICRRILFEMFNQYPQSMPFRDCSDLNFPEYLEVVKKPIALDIIKEKLSADNPEQYATKELFLKDLRRVFRNCYSFHERDSEFFQHARELEEYLDRQLEIWLPDLAYDETLSEVLDVTRDKKKNKERDYSPSNEESTSKKRKRSESDGSDSPKKKKKKKKRKDQSEDDSMSEGEKLDYLDALEASLHDKKSAQSKRANFQSEDHSKKVGGAAKDAIVQNEEKQTDVPTEINTKGKGKGKRSSARIRR